MFSRAIRAGFRSHPPCPANGTERHENMPKRAPRDPLFRHPDPAPGAGEIPPKIRGSPRTRSPPRASFTFQSFNEGRRLGSTASDVGIERTSFPNTHSARGARRSKCVCTLALVGLDDGQSKVKRPLTYRLGFFKGASWQWRLARLGPRCISRANTLRSLVAGVVRRMRVTRPKT